MSSVPYRGVTRLGMDVHKDSISIGILAPEDDVAEVDKIFTMRRRFGVSSLGSAIPPAGGGVLRGGTYGIGAASAAGVDGVALRGDRPVASPGHGCRWSPADSRHYNPQDCEQHAVPFAMYLAFPRSDYYEDSAPSQGHRPTTSLPAPGHDSRTEGRPQDGSHVHCDRSTSEAPSFSPCSIATGTSQSSPWPPHRPCSPATESPQPNMSGRALRSGPYPPGWSRFWT